MALQIELLKEDCLKGMLEMSASSVDLVIADLPYGTTRNSWDSVLDLDRFFAGLDHVCKPNAAVLMFASNRFMARLISGPWAKHFRYDLVWAKNKPRGHLNANRMPMRTHENILVFYKKTPIFNPLNNTPGCWNFIGTPNGAPKNRGSSGSSYGATKSNQGSRTGTKDRFPGSVLMYPVVNEVNIVHPTQKPVELLEALIEMYSKPGQLVFDPTMGVGSTGVAAANKNRSFTGFEINNEYFNEASSRVQKAIEK